MKRLLVLIALALFTFPLGGCNPPLLGTCSNSIIQSVYSPDKRFKAVIFGRNCGATSGFDTQVSVLPGQTALSDDDGGNVFIVDGDHGAAPMGRGGGPNVWVKWLGTKKLQIVYDRRARTFLKEKQSQGVSVIYKKN